MHESAAVIRLHDEGLGKRIENTSREIGWFSNQRHEILAADLFRNVFTYFQLVAEVAEAWIGFEAAPQDFFIECRRIAQLWKSSDPATMINGQVQVIGQPVPYAVKQRLRESHLLPSFILYVRRNPVRPFLRPRVKCEPNFAAALFIAVGTSSKP
ncbi:MULTISPECIES: hypothetical protein [Caballeronia]|uniref:hypothetical protein n=1 Tax=Caballeronia TaxID=1827195 RepID=UPI001EF722FC|nr:hypothetical protein [Caballeronia zhejiangensis]MCG7403394.1 hypothetical protein [Caballeronia zhejiangensis]